MSAWGKRQNRSNPYGARLGFESLERREVMSGNHVFTLTSGSTVKFTDADGTKVSVKLMGPGSGSFSLTNGAINGGSIAAMTINGTTSASQLKITAAGGADDVAIIGKLTVNSPLSQLSTTAIDVASGGLLTFNGTVGGVNLNKIGSGSTINVNGSLNSLTAVAVDYGAAVNVSGTLATFNVQTLGSGGELAEVSAAALTKLIVSGAMNAAVIKVGAGGVQSAYLGTGDNAQISSAGAIKSLVVKGAISNSGFAVNRHPGSDGKHGTIDDYTINHASVNTIDSATFNGPVSDVKLISTTKVGKVSGSGATQVTVLDDVFSEFIPLDIAQAVANATGYGDGDIWIAVYGQETVTGPTYFLDSSSLNPAQTAPLPVVTSTLSTGPDTADQAILPSSTILAWANTTSNLQLPVPQPGSAFSGRILISVGAPVQAQITTADGTVAAPSASNAADPSTGTFYDFLEFTVTNSTAGVVNVDINTSQIDSFGFPMKLQLFQDALGQVPFTVNFTGTPTQGNKTITNVSSVSGLQVGQIISGTGIALGSMIESIDSTDSSNLKVTLSLAATVNASGSATSLAAPNGGPVGVEFTRHEILDGADSTSLLNFLQNLPTTAQSEMAQPFLQSVAPFAINAATPMTGVSNPGGGQPIVVTVSSVGNLQNGDVVEISGSGVASANGYFVVSNVTATTFTLENSAGGSAANSSSGTWRGYTSGPRLVSPKDIVERLTDQESENQLNNYFNETVDAFFNKYLPIADGGLGDSFSITSAASGATLTYTGTVQNVAGFGYILFLQSPAPQDPSTPHQPFAIFYPFTTENTPANYTPQLTPIAPLPWLSAGGAGIQLQTPSQMIFACDAFLADNTFRLPYYEKQGVQFQPTWSAELADLENSIASAFNRGVALNDPSTWGDETTWFDETSPQGANYNYWVEYWHENGVEINDLAYAYPYDDKYNRSSTLNQNGVGLIQVQLGQWSAVQAPTTTTFVSISPNPGQQGPVTIQAHVGPAVNPHSLTGTVTFFIDGVPINSTDSGPSPPQQPITVDGNGHATITATLPPLPDGSVNHTYTLTAVYSGDQYTAPSVASQPLQLTGVNGDFLMTYTPTGTQPAGSNITISSAQLPGGTFNGTLALSIATNPQGGGSLPLSTINIGGSTFSTPVTIPTGLSGSYWIIGLFTPLSGGPYTGVMEINVSS